MARTKSHGSKRIVVAFVAVLALAGAGIAFAYWTSTGTGDGTANTGVATAFTITSDTPVGTIAPGNAGQTVGFTVTNPSPGPLYLNVVTVTLANADGTPWVPPTGCLIEDFTATISTPPPVGDVPGGGSVGGEATVTLDNTAVNQDACQGVSVPLYFVAS